MDYKALFNQMLPDFFQREYIKNLDPEEIFEEQLMLLPKFDVNAVEIPVPAGVTFGIFQGNREELLSAVRAVEEDWISYFGKEDRVFCAFCDNKIVSFCILDDMGEYDLEGCHIRIAGPGCVGTVPAFRRQGIGLKMVQLATDILKKEGYDYSYIHYTAVGHWYARLAYETILRWNCKGFEDT